MRVDWSKYIAQLNTPLESDAPLDDLLAAVGRSSKDPEARLLALLRNARGPWRVPADEMLWGEDEHAFGLDVDAFQSCPDELFYERIVQGLKTGAAPCTPSGVEFDGIEARSQFHCAHTLCVGIDDLVLSSNTPAKVLWQGPARPGSWYCYVEGEAFGVGYRLTGAPGPFNHTVAAFATEGTSMYGVSGSRRGGSNLALQTLEATHATTRPSKAVCF